TAHPPDGLVEPGHPLRDFEELSLLAARRFVYDAPNNRPGRDLLAPAALAARAGALVALGRRYIPDVLETLEPLEDVGDAAEATILSEAVYECMPYASLSREFLERLPDLALLPVPDALREMRHARPHLASGSADRPVRLTFAGPCGWQPMRPSRARRQRLEFDAAAMQARHALHGHEPDTVVSGLRAVQQTDQKLGVRGAQTGAVIS